jgi:hypothetical protein
MLLVLVSHRQAFNRYQWERQLYLGMSTEQNALRLATATSTSIMGKYENRERSFTYPLSNDRQG